MKKAIAVFVMAFVCSTAVFAQAVAGLGAISGSVRDASGAAVPDAQVVVANPSKGIRRALSSTDAGNFTATSLVPASGYEITVNKQGFATFELKNIDVAVGQNINIVATLTVAGASTQIEVAAVAPIIESTKTDVSHVMNSNQITNLPINGRRVDSFVLLSPSVVPDGTFGLVSFRGIAGGNSFLTDGNDTTNSFYNENAGRTRISSQISQDAVQEFQVLSNGYSAEFGRASGGVVNTVTRSGTNDVHGTGYWFFRNQDFSARDRFATINPDESRHQAGGSAGGRIIKDKLFYFGNFEVTRRDFPLLASITSNPLFDSSGKFQTSQCGAPATQAQCDAAIKFLDRNFGVVPRTANSELGFLKFDYRPTERNSFSASFNYLRWLSPMGIQTQAVLNNGNGIGNNANSTVRNRYGRFSWTAVPDATSVNEFRFGWFKDKLFDYPNPDYSIPGIGFLTLTVQTQTNLGHLPPPEPQREPLPVHRQLHQDPGQAHLEGGLRHHEHGRLQRHHAQPERHVRVSVVHGVCAGLHRQHHRGEALHQLLAALWQFRGRPDHVGLRLLRSGPVQDHSQPDLQLRPALRREQDSAAHRNQSGIPGHGRDQHSEEELCAARRPRLRLQ
jgi:hypothetical protein